MPRQVRLAGSTVSFGRFSSGRGFDYGAGETVEMTRASVLETPIQAVDPGQPRWVDSRWVERIGTSLRDFPLPPVATASTTTGLARAAPASRLAPDLAPRSA